MAAKKDARAHVGQTKAQAAAAQKEKELRNPITGQAPNSFSQPTNRELPRPVAVRSAREMPAADRRNLRQAHLNATEPRQSNSYSPANAPVFGYHKPEGIDNETWARVMGGQHMFPNMGAANGNPAINEPHEAHPGVTVQRRAEDLAGPEYRKGLETLANYGHDPRNPMRSLMAVQTQNLHRVMAEHAAAGVEENASQHFYGGSPIQTRIPDPDLQAEHEEKMTDAQFRFHQGADRLARHPGFQPMTPGMSDLERRGAATMAMGQATADTSPNARWRRGTHEGKISYPNMDQAEESASAAVEHRSPDYITGRIQNAHKAARRVADMAQGISDNGEPTEKWQAHQYGNPTTAAKTVAFRGAMIEPNAADAYKVSDVHEGGNMIPGAATGKAISYRDSAGKRVYHYPDQPDSHVAGMAQEYTDNGKPMRHNARAEDMLDSGGTVHALNDYASRRVLAEHGLSRGVNYADNVHTSQAAPWGSQQARRTEPQMADVSHATQYPVIRDWGAEGDASGIRDEWQHLFAHVSGNLSPQFVRNPNTSGVVNPARDPYPIMPKTGPAGGQPLNRR